MKKPLLFFLIITGLLTSCLDGTSDLPPVNGADPTNIHANITIAALKAMYTGTSSMQLADSLIIVGVVVADDQTGNFYKSIAIQDATGGILIRMNSTTLYQTYPVGRRLFIKLGGLWMGDYGGLIQIGGSKTLGSLTQVDPISSNVFDNYVIKGSLNNQVDPVDVTISQLDNTYQNMLIRIQHVQFSVADTNKTYADAVGQISQNVNLEDCSGNTIIVRTSGYATFAGADVPDNNGEFVGVYSYYSPTPQLMIRNTSDLKMNGPRCGPYVKKDFEDNSLTSGGWTTQQVSGPSVNWSVNNIGSQFGSYYAQCKNYLPPNIACETWFISPSFSLASGVNPVLSFENSWKYTGTSLTVWASTNYVSGLPSTATWDNITASATWSGGNFVWANSGNVPLSVYNGNTNVHIAFKYIGSGSDGSTWEIDNILITEP